MRGPVEVLFPRTRMEAKERAHPGGAPGSVWDRDARTFMGALALVIVTGILAWFVFATVYGIAVGAPPSSGSSSGRTGAIPVNVYLTIVNTANGRDQYLPANFSVPANTPLDFQITSYDNGVNNLSGSSWNVSGTVGGTEMITGGAPGTPQRTVSSVPYADAAHTFTDLSRGFNVVVPPAASPTDPVVVTFTLVLTGPGTLMWYCIAPCDSLSMATPGFMTGTITVT